MFRRLLRQPIANNGSQLRDHQANERTFLSWTRMGLAFAAMGLALGRLSMIDRFFATYEHRNENASNTSNPASKPKFLTEEILLASQVCQVSSVWTFGYGIFRYLSVRHHLLRGQFVPALWGPIIGTGGLLGLWGLTATYSR
ncbi:hypothetical protein ASPZODRAFT_136913 [Penicilliopsis zonata CBS 506.65]|uniref:DUF202 domain-containing protein n=1 Tax=Penicilliopsis zonata CBS 506.65 TaxID=1073090 RepID=A0A1L9S6H7_9EURO|nr:hypothetical protein ASPZODRAFT_136913 [Penicilliopsis zonata CBS 506.65]OJJ42772.1 hypothetical protein ASPZODRAFT_136913 [Penicilliopsis zonata CBS 506.65]